MIPNWQIRLSDYQSFLSETRVSLVVNLTVINFILICTPQPLRAVGVLFSLKESGWVGGLRKKFVRAVAQKP